MKRFYFQPKKELSHIVKAIEVLDLPDVSTNNFGNRFIPDGNFEIGFNLGSDDIKFSSTKDTKIHQHNPIGYFYTQSSGSSNLIAEGRLHIMIVKLYPWAAHLFSEINLGECVDETLELKYVMGNDVASLEEQILGSDTYQKQIELLQDYVILKLAKLDKTQHVLIEHATKLIFHSKGKIKMKQLAIETRTSIRTIQRWFHQYYGISPKVMAQQLRLRNFADLLAQDRKSNFTELALQCGYYDQAHFNHEFKSIVRMTPSEYFNENIPLFDGFLKFS